MTLQALRITAILSALVVLFQGLSASWVINGGDPALGPHETGAIVLHVTTGLLAIAAIALWRLDGAPIWIPITAVVFFGATFAEAALGHKFSLWAHVPIAMIFVVASVVLVAVGFMRVGTGRRVGTRV